MRNYALVVRDGDRETSLSEILELQAWLSRRYMPLLAQYVEQISRVQAMTRSHIWREHLPTPATKHKRVASDVALDVSAVDEDYISFE